MPDRETRAGLMFLAPNAIGFLVFHAIAIVAALGLSLTDWDVLTRPSFIGLANYRQLAFDPVFRVAAWNTAVYVVVVVPIGVALALALAISFQHVRHAVYPLRLAFLLPTVVSAVAVAVVWRWIYHTDYGLLNAGLSALGVRAVPWLSSSDWALPSVMLVAVWKGIGFDLIVFLAGMRAIPTHLYEAAALDGASGWQRFWHVTLPLLAPTTFFVTVLSIIRAAQVFDLAYVLTGGGPANATNTIVLAIYQSAFQLLNMGYAAAAAWVLFLFVAAATFIQTRVQPGWAYDD